MRVLITGSKGFVGSETVKLLKEKGVEVVEYDIMDGLDIRDKGLFERVIADKMPDRILHLAAIARFAEADKDPMLAHEINVLGTKNVAEIAGKYHIPLVFSSTGSVYMPITKEPPITEEFECKGNSVYGCTKYMGELYVRSLAMPWIVLRYGHLLGAEKRFHGLIGGFLSRIERGLVPTLYGGSQTNSFVYIKDIARANHLALTASWDKWNNVFNIGSPEEISAEDAGKAVCEIFGYNGKIERKEMRTVDPLRFWMDTKKAEALLSFETEYSLREGLLDMKKELDNKPNEKS